MDAPTTQIVRLSSQHPSQGSQAKKNGFSDLESLGNPPSRLCTTVTVKKIRSVLSLWYNSWSQSLSPSLSSATDDSQPFALFRFAHWLRTLGPFSFCSLTPNCPLPCCACIKPEMLNNYWYVSPPSHPIASLPTTTLCSLHSGWVTIRWFSTYLRA